ncbi:rhomboid family intramembrane serine protease [Uliginosibacterium paludis]|uniref:Rhomboid family intramembrane serine protease n=1 Tax=Uliginosibacterium paludis TaxID=1615952 RepID=A0ABV2CNW9_9RHOO
MIMMPWIASLTRSRIPVGVILIVLVNAFVFFVLQGGDEHREALMGEYYSGSALPAIELPAYERYLESRAERKPLERLRRMKKANAVLPAAGMMERDADFMRELRAGRIVSDEDERFAEWRLARTHFDAMQDRLFTSKYSFQPDRPGVIQAFSHQFLHANLGHIGGNMLFLILIAPAVEALIGTGAFLLVYLAGGLGALGMHLLLAPAGGGLLGASGAISAVMGAFAALLGMRRIPFFYSIVIYFDVIRAPALLALPLWLANEAVQFIWFSEASNVAYAAHFGGLLTGALLVLPLRRRALANLLPEAPAGQDAARATTASATAQALQQARRLMASQRFEEARKAYLRAAQDPACRPEDLREASNLMRLAPASAEYHALIGLVCGRLLAEPRLPAGLIEPLTDYLKQAKPAVRLRPESLIALIERFAQAGQLPALEGCARALQDLAPAHPDAARALLRAAQTLQAGGAWQAAAALARKPQA